MPPKYMLSDNAAMIGWACIQKYSKKQYSDIFFKPNPRLTINKLNAMKYWLLKSEPETWSWENQLKANVEMWDGVRNYQARNNLMKMKKGDLCFFYHSVKEKKIVGSSRSCQKSIILIRLTKQKSLWQ